MAKSVAEAFFTPDAIRQWEGEEERLEREIASKKAELESVQKLLEVAANLTQDRANQGSAPDKKIIEDIDTSNVMGTLAKIANSSPKPLTKPQLRAAAIKAGVDPKRLKGAYFYVAINRMKKAERVSVDDDGSVWRGTKN